MTEKNTIPSSHLTPDELDNFRNTLEELREQLTGNINDLHLDALEAGESISTSKLPLDNAENASAAYDQDLNLAFMESEEHLLKMVDDALRRIEDGVYGICTVTGEPIDKERLELLPYTPYSLEAQRMIEEGGVQPVGNDDDADLFDDDNDDDNGDDDADADD